MSEPTVNAIDLYGKEYTVPVSDLRWRPSAYAVVVKNDCLLVAPQFGAYALPGGGVELGETPEEAVVRETFEETGVHVKDLRLAACRSSFFVMNGSAKGEFVQSLLLFYVCEYDGGELSSEHFMEDEKDNMSAPEWLPLSKLDEIKVGGSVDWRAIVKDALHLHE